MKSVATYLVIAVFALSTIFVPSVVSAKEKETKQLDVLLTCLSCKPPVKGQPQTAARRADGSVSVNLPAAGAYTIRYATGPHKGEVIETVNATKAGRHDIAMNAIRNVK